MPNPAALDSLDLKILARLQEQARIPNVDLAQSVSLSPSPCLRRVRELERRGVIRRYVTLVDPEAVGLPVSVFINVTLEKQVEEALEVFEAAIRERPEVMECYLMTGESDYLLRVVTADLAAYQRFLMDHLTRIPGVANIKSSFALRQVQYRTAMPLDAVAEGRPPGGVAADAPKGAGRRRDLRSAAARRRGPRHASRGQARR